MPVHERRQHFRIDDRVYFNYRILTPSEFCSDSVIISQLLGEQGKKFMETAQYFHEIDTQLSELTQEIALENATLAHYLNLLNSKIDYLSQQILTSGHIELRKVNLSLGGISFITPTEVKENTLIKAVLYTKPKMVPIILDGRVIYSKFHNEAHYRTSIQFNNLTSEQEQLLSQHILLAQIKNRSD